MSHENAKLQTPSRGWGWTRLRGLPRLPLQRRRRRLLVNPRYQLRSSLVSVAVVMALLVLLNLSLFLSARQVEDGFVRSVPQLEAYARAQERLQFDLILAGSVVFLIGVFATSLLESHRTVGAALSLVRHLRALQTGHYRTRLRLRRGDRLRGVEAAFNELAQALRDRTLEEIETLRQLASAVRAGRDDRIATAKALETLADTQHRLVE